MLRQKCRSLGHQRAVTRWKTSSGETTTFHQVRLLWSFGSSIVRQYGLNMGKGSMRAVLAHRSVQARRKLTLKHWKLGGLYNYDYSTFTFACQAVTLWRKWGSRVLCGRSTFISAWDLVMHLDQWKLCGRCAFMSCCHLLTRLSWWK